LTVEFDYPTFPAPKGGPAYANRARAFLEGRALVVTEPTQEPAVFSTMRAPMPRPNAPKGTDAHSFVRYAEGMRLRVEAGLEEWLRQKASETKNLPPDARAPIEAAFDLTKRGGKRLRAVLVIAAYESFHGEGGVDAVLPAAVAMEVLQAYLLIHDDWMDRDEIRRGGPSVPAMMRARFSDGGLADASAILAGDYAAGLALDALLSVSCPPDRVARAAREFARVEKDVVAGQLLDVHGSGCSVRFGAPAPNHPFVSRS
jgi:geranylgeranyl diphosphate synthase, type I